MNCENCGNEHDRSYGSGRFCSSKCARGFSTRDKRSLINEKASKTLTEKGSWNKGMGNFLQKICIVCNEKFEAKDTQIGRKQKCCGIKCSSKLGYGLVTDVKKMYRVLCQFKFNVYEYKDFFNLDLIKEHGWYKAKNRGDNLNGISRDHLYSIHQGFKNKINPYLVSHPANCELVQHFLNNRKNTNNFIFIEELIKRINLFNEEYSQNKFDSKIYLTNKEIENMYMTPMPIG